MKPISQTTKHWGQLPEVLMAMAIGMVIAGSALQLLIGVWNETGDTYRQIETFQETQLVQKEWRQFVHRCPSLLTPDANGDLVAKTASAKIAPENTLILTIEKKQRKLTLPPNINVSAAVETSPQGMPLAVLTLGWSDREGDRKINRRRRIVAVNSLWKNRS